MPSELFSAPHDFSVLLDSCEFGTSNCLVAYYDNYTTVIGLQRVQNLKMANRTKMASLPPSDALYSRINPRSLYNAADMASFTSLEVRSHQFKLPKGYFIFTFSQTARFSLRHRFRPF